MAESELEIARLEAILKGMPTTEAEDREELAKAAAAAKAAGDAEGWKREVVLQFRAERKRSISFRIAKLKDKVEGGKEL